jgi:hypothetical protein
MIGGGILCLVPIQRQRHLLSEGRASPGVVTGHQKHQHGTEIRYEFRLLSGSSAKGRGVAGKSPVPIGTAVCVLYDAESPHRNAMYPLSLVQLSP